MEGKKERKKERKNGHNSSNAFVEVKTWIA
jgi:hypothetical protein